MRALSFSIRGTSLQIRYGRSSTAARRPNYLLRWKLFIDDGQCRKLISLINEITAIAILRLFRIARLFSLVFFTIHNAIARDRRITVYKPLIATGNCDIIGVKSMKIRGVTITDDLHATKLVDNLIASCSQSM